MFLNLQMQSNRAKRLKCRVNFHEVECALPPPQLNRVGDGA